MGVEMGMGMRAGMVVLVPLCKTRSRVRFLVLRNLLLLFKLGWRYTFCGSQAVES